MHGFFSLCGSQLVMLIQRMRTYRLFFFCRSVFSCFLKCWDHHICNGTKKIALFRRSRDFKHFFLQRNVFLNCVGVSQVNGLDIGWYVDVITRLTTGNVSTKFFFRLRCKYTCKLNHDRHREKTYRVQNNIDTNSFTLRKMEWREKKSASF